MTAADRFFAQVFAPRADRENAPRYQPYARTKAVLRDLAARYPGGPAALVRAVGWHRTDPSAWVERWVSLRGRVPAALLRVLDAEDLVRRAVAEDVAAFDHAARDLPAVTSFVERVMPGVMRRRDLPRAMTPDEALRYVRNHATATRLACCIHFGVRTAFVRDDGSAFYTEHRPAMRVNGPWITFADAGTALGRTTVE
jgi:hypothetical protein